LGSSREPLEQSASFMKTAASRPTRLRDIASQPASPLGFGAALAAAAAEKAEAATKIGPFIVVGSSESRPFQEELAALFNALSSGKMGKAGKANIQIWARFLESAYRDYGCERWGFDPVPLSSVVQSHCEGGVTWEEFRRWQSLWLSSLTVKESSKSALLSWLTAEVHLSNRIKEAYESCAGDDAGLISAVGAIARRGPASKEALKVLEPVRERLKKQMEEAAKVGDMASWKQAKELAVQAEMSRPELDAAEAQMTAVREAKGITLEFTFPGGDRTSLRAFPVETVGDLKARLLVARGSPEHAHVQISVGTRLLDDDEPAARLEAMAPILAVLGFDGAALADEAAQLVDSIRRFKQAVEEVSGMSKPPAAVHVCCEVLQCLLAEQDGIPRVRKFPSPLRVPEDLSPFANFRRMLSSPGFYSLLKRFPGLVASGSVPKANFKAAKMVSEATWLDSHGYRAKMTRELLSKTSSFCTVMAEWSQLMLRYHQIVSP